jgi:hypothetical protein
MTACAREVIAAPLTDRVLLVVQFADLVLGALELVAGSRWCLMETRVHTERCSIKQQQ